MPSKTNKRIPEQPRWERTKRIAYRFLIEHEINSLPVDPFMIAKLLEIPVASAGEMSESMNRSRLYVLKKIIKSNDGAVIFIDGVQFIGYNETIRSKGRIRWTIMHEIGHIVLNHLVDFKKTGVERGGLTKKEYKVLEREADFFAGHVLAPPVILHKINARNYSEILKVCNLSEEAAINRANFQNRWRPTINELSFKLILQFKNFIHRKKCNNCSFWFISSEAKFCPICGEKLIWGKENMIYDDGYKLDENSKAIICPICQNEEIDGEGDYCKICGTYLINKCANKIDYAANGEECLIQKSCSNLAEGNARFCIHCGNPTTFFIKNILESWDKYGEGETISAFTMDDDVPF